MNDTYSPEEDVCHRCSSIHNEKWKRYKTYKGIDQHHNPPEFISVFLEEEWSGEFYNLCRDCHTKLHKEIKKILNKHSNSLKFINSEYWTLKKMTSAQIKEAKEEIYNFTKKWVENRDDS